MAQTSTKKLRGADAKRLAMRNKFWPDVKESDLWLRSTRVGFTTIPRTMPLIGRIMDHLSGKGLPLFGTYLSLWCRVYDEAFVEVRNDRELAFESGFSGGRGEVTWRTRMRYLRDFGFIDIRPGAASDVQYVLIMNPIKVIARIYKEEGRTEDAAFSTLTARLVEIGATDLEDDLDEFKKVEEEDDGLG